MHLKKNQRDIRKLNFENFPRHINAQLYIKKVCKLSLNPAQ